MNHQDKIDRHSRISKRIWSVYLLPIIITFSVLGISYLITDNFKLDAADKFFAYLISVTIGVAVYLKNRFRWLPLPDGSYINSDELRDTSMTSPEKNISFVNEPTYYIAEFPYLLSSKIVSIICGLTMIAGGIYILSKSSVIMPLVLATGGLFVFYSGFKELKDTGAKLKLAETGLWTKELGFKTWSSIKKTVIKVDKGMRDSRTYLEIYLNESEIDFPDQRLSIDDLKNTKKIKPMIDELSKR